MMNCTSAQANKQLHNLNNERDLLLGRETTNKTFVAATVEDTESVRPDYSFTATQQKLAELEQKIRALKHSVNVFNTTHTVPGFSMTVDEMLVYIPQLTAQKRKLFIMKSETPKKRVEERYARGGGIIDYKYINYDMLDVESAYKAVCDELARAQLALDVLNTSEIFDFAM